MRLRFILLLIFLPTAAFAQDISVSGEPRAPKCPYPDHPINWVMLYCMWEAQTGDEIAIGNSPCYKKAEKDLNQKDKCAIIKKYKTKHCQKLALKNPTLHSSLQDCLMDEKIKSYDPAGHAGD